MKCARCKKATNSLKFVDDMKLCEDCNKLYVIKYRHKFEMLERYMDDLRKEFKDVETNKGNC